MWTKNFQMHKLDLEKAEEPEIKLSISIGLEKTREFQKNNYCFTDYFIENPLDCKKIKLVNPKGNQPWIYTGRTDAEAEAPVPWPPDAKSQPPI